MPSRFLSSLLVVCITQASPCLAIESTPTFAATDIEFFERRVRPLLVEHCYECHSAKSESIEGGLRLDSRSSMLAGGDTQPAVVPGQPDRSLLIDAIQYGELYEMPPKRKLPEATIAVFREWIRRGAPWPDEKGDAGSRPGKAFDLQERKQAHWAWKQIAKPPLPKVVDAAWPSRPVDRFVLAKLEGVNLRPAPDAEPHTLLRRAYFDLIGLPPPPEAVAAYQADPTPAAFAAIVDQLLASPQFGERWGRHWLDLMRYAETRGHEYDPVTPNAWQYRDYVIRAFNADVPYDQFVTEHIAGDLIERPRLNPDQRFNESILATGFWHLGEWLHSPVDIRKDETDRFDNAIDVFGKAFLGLTVACARCHDHKFDAISQHDYYALAGFLQSSEYRQVRFETLDHNREIVRRLGELRRTSGPAIGEAAARRLLDSEHPIDSLLVAAAYALAGGGADVAEQRGVTVEALTPWLAELERAADNPRHPLFGLASAASTAALPTASSQVRGGRETWKLPDSAQVVVDYDAADADWMVDGPAYGAGPLRRGDVLPANAGATPIAEIVSRGRAQLDPVLANIELAAGVEPDPVQQNSGSGGESDDWVKRPGRVLRTPTVMLRGGKLFYLIRGAARVQAVVDSHRLLQGPLHQETLKTIQRRGEWRWVEHDLTRHIGHRVHVEFSPSGERPLEVSLVVEGEQEPALPIFDDALAVAAALSDGVSTTTNIEQLAREYAALIVQSLQRLAEHDLHDSAAHRALAAWAVRRAELWPSQNDDGVSKILNNYRQQRTALLQELHLQSATAPAMWDGGSENERLLIRGNSRTPGPLVERRLLTAIAGDDQPPIQEGSGRLELARRIFAPNNPFPARVMVNRIWHHLIGRGIVPSVDNFGVLGRDPTHPELLDHLATRFVDDRWSIKALIREVMLSRTYQMASRRDPAADELDPQNLLLHRMPVRRLQAEAIRDSMLRLAGRLDLQQFGPSVPVHLTEFMNGRGRPAESGPLDGAGRRSVYLSVRRNFLSPMMLAFDAPQPAGPVGRRGASNVPAQALILMNNPFVVQQARRFAERLLTSEADQHQRIRRMYLEAFARPPDEQEAGAAHDFLRAQAAQYKLAGATNRAEADAWTDLCHVIFNLKEFIYIN